MKPVWGILRVKWYDVKHSNIVMQRHRGRKDEDPSGYTSGWKDETPSCRLFKKCDDVCNSVPTRRRAGNILRLFGSSREGQSRGRCNDLLMVQKAASEERNPPPYTFLTAAWFALPPLWLLPALRATACLPCLPALSSHSFGYEVTVGRELFHGCGGAPPGSITLRIEHSRHTIGIYLGAIYPLLPKYRFASSQRHSDTARCQGRGRAHGRRAQGSEG